METSIWIDYVYFKNVREVRPSVACDGGIKLEEGLDFQTTIPHVKTISLYTNPKFSMSCLFKNG